MKRLLQHIWAWPLTFVAYCIFRYGCRYVSTINGARIYIGEGGLSKWYLLTYRFIGFAWGEMVVLLDEDSINKPTLIHELEHVAQARRLGVFLPLLYILSSLCAVAAGMEWYVDNVFEQAARQAARRK